MPASAEQPLTTAPSSSDEGAVVALIHSLIDYNNFDTSLKVLQLVSLLRPSLVPVLMRTIPHPELLRSNIPLLQNLLVRVDDLTLARFIAAAGEKIALRLMVNISTNRRARLTKIIEEKRESLHEGPLKPYHKLYYYLSYLFIYNQVKAYLSHG